MPDKKNLKIQIEALLQSVQIHFPKNGQKLVVYLLFYKRYCTLIRYGYISNLSINHIENNLTEVSKENRNGQHIFKTLLNFNNDLSENLFELLKEFTSSITKNDIDNYKLNRERKFETVLYYFTNIDVSILDVSIKDFGDLFKEILSNVYKNDFREDKTLNEFLIKISQLNGTKLYINNPKLGNIILDTLPILENNYSLFHINKEGSLAARMNLIMNGYYSFNFSKESVSTVIIDNKKLYLLDNKELILTIDSNLKRFNYSEQLLFLLPVKRIQELEFNDELLKRLVSVIKFNKHQGILIFRQNWQEFENDIAIISRYFENEVQKDTIQLYQNFIQKKSDEERNYFRIERLKDIQKENNKIDLNEKEPKSSIQLINESLENLNSKIEQISDATLSKEIKSDIGAIAKSIKEKVILPNFIFNSKWENLYIFLKKELKKINSDKIEVLSNFQNLTLLDLKINPNLFKNLLQYIDYNLAENNLCRVEFTNLKQKNKIRISLLASIETLFDGYIEQLGFIAEIHDGFIKHHKKIYLQSNQYYKIVSIDIPYAKELKHQTIEKLVKNEVTGVLEKKDIYLVSDEIGNENIIRGLNIQDIINGNLGDDEAHVIQKLRFQSSLEMFSQLNTELTTKRTSFKVELPNDELVKDYIIQEIKSQNWRQESNINEDKNFTTIYLKAETTPSPSKIVDFFNKFHNSDRLKYITHDYDVPNSKFDYDIFLKEAEEEFETIIQTIGVHQTLEILIKEFAFKEPKDRIGLSNLGWKDERVKIWCANNLYKHPINNPKFSKEIFDVFKNKIEVRENQLINYLDSSIKEKLGKELYLKAKINFSEELDMTTFYTNVEQILSGIRDLFAPIKERLTENPNIDIWVIDHFENIYEASVELIILHKNSFANKSTDNPNLFKGDLLSAKKKFEGLCDWAIESSFKDGYYRLNILNDNEGTPKKILIEKDKIKGFSHHLTFYI